MDKPVTMEALSAPDKKAEKEAKKAERAAKAAEKKAAKAKGGDAVDISDAPEKIDVDKELAGDAEGKLKLTKEQLRVASNRATTGVLASTAVARDVKFASFSVSLGGRSLVSDCDLELTQGCRYGLLGENGSGKSSVLAAIAQREVPLPKHISVFHLHEEAPPTEMTGVEAVVNHVKEEVEKLEAMVEQIMEESGMEDERLTSINSRLDELDPTGAEPRARKILSGLGFADHLVPMDRQTKHMSGGWRMRVALAQALFAAPELLLLDEPTNHLDLEACVWLEEHLASYSKCLLVVSHSQDFLNAVCTHTMWLTHGTIKYYGGNYAYFVRTVEEEERLQLKVYEKQQADMGKLEKFVEVNRANGVATSAKSKKKVLGKLQDDAVDKPMLREPSFVFKFPECSRLAPPVLPFDEVTCRQERHPGPRAEANLLLASPRLLLLRSLLSSPSLGLPSSPSSLGQVSFAYSGKKEDYLYADLNLGVDCDSRVALVGPNGCGKLTLLEVPRSRSESFRVLPTPAESVRFLLVPSDSLSGKSTLLKLMSGELSPSEGSVKRHQHCSLGLYHQHSIEVLDLDMTPLNFMRKTFPPAVVKRTEEARARPPCLPRARAPAPTADAPSHRLESPLLGRCGAPSSRSSGSRNSSRRRRWASSLTASARASSSRCSR